jgi:hypothetical protein
VISEAGAVAEPVLRSALLSAVAARLPAALLDDAVSRARVIEPARLRARPLARLARHLTGGAREDLQREAMLGARRTSPGALPPPEEVEIILRSVAGELTAAVLEEAADLARTIPDEERRVAVQAAPLSAAPAPTSGPGWSPASPARR